MMDYSFKQLNKVCKIENLQTQIPHIQRNEQTFYWLNKDTTSKTIFFIHYPQIFGENNINLPDDPFCTVVL